MARLIPVEELTVLCPQLVHRVGPLLIEILSIIVKCELVFLLIASELANDIIRASVLTLLQHAD